eukprot:107598-Rhodomonas_salina.1
MAALPPTACVNGSAACVNGSTVRLCRIAHCSGASGNGTGLPPEMAAAHPKTAARCSHRGQQPAGGAAVGSPRLVQQHALGQYRHRVAHAEQYTLGP